MTRPTRPLATALLATFFCLCLSACGLEGPPPAGQVPGSPATGGFVPAD